MLKDYKLVSFEKGDFQDFHKNYWCTAVFEGVGEPIKWVVKDPTKVTEGETYYGEIKEETSKAGKSYLRFYKKQAPDAQGASQGGGSSAYSGERSDGMRQGMCINNAANFINAQNVANSMTPAEWAQMVYEFARALYSLGELTAANVPPAVSDAFNVTNEDMDKPINLSDIPF